MSSYEKSQQADLLDYGTSGVLHNPTSFGPFAQPPYSSQLLYPSSVNDNTHEADHLHYVASPVLAAQHQMEESGTALIDPRFRQFPQITSFSPLHGLQGSTVCIYVQSIHELRASPRITFSLVFGSKRVQCALEPISDINGSPKQFLLAAEVPPFPSTGWHAFNVPLRMVMESSSADTTPLAVDVGEFSYTGQIIPHDAGRKRKLSLDSEGAVQRPVKKQVQSEQASESGIYSTSPYSPFISTPVASSAPPLGHGQGTSPRVSAHRYSASIASATSVKAQSPQTPASWSPSFTLVNQTDSGASSSATPGQRSAAEGYTDKSGAPALIRTSTMQQSPICMSSATSHSFNPYAMYPSKAVLKLNGDLDLMAEEWSIEEWDAKRRLVQFTRRQNGSTIHTDFEAVAPEDRQPNSICISCIWWEEKKDCYVTSVDTIFLLESLVAVRFTVEEKNRIRRNLEGFRPLTVSKSKADSEEFFKIIMGFPNPKPRNIEKDVKVFPWKILAHALKKIISKYSASYSSTAGALPNPMGPHYPGNGPSDPRTEIRTSTSPQLNGMSRGASPYQVSTVSFPPHMSQRVSVPISSGPPPDLRLQVPPQMAPVYSYPPTHPHQPQSHYSQPLRRSPQPMSGPPGAGRMVGSWESDDYASFESGHADPTGNMEAFSCNRLLGSMPTSQEFLPPTSYSISQSGI